MDNWTDPTEPLFLSLKKTNGRVRESIFQRLRLNKQMPHFGCTTGRREGLPPPPPILLSVNSRFDYKEKQFCPPNPYSSPGTWLLPTHFLTANTHLLHQDFAWNFPPSTADPTPRPGTSGWTKAFSQCRSQCPKPLSNRHVLNHRLSRCKTEALPLSGLAFHLAFWG